MKLFISLIIAFVLNYGCHSQKFGKSDPDTFESSLKAIAFKKYKNDTVFVYSPGKHHVLCNNGKAVNLSRNPNELLHFFVYDLKSGKIVYEDKISGAKISWQSEFELVIKKQRGIITSPEDKGRDVYIYDLREKKKKLIKSEK